MTPHRKFFCWNLGATFSSVLHMEQIYSLLQNRGVEWTEVHWTALYICSGLCNSICFSAKLSRGNHIFTFLPNTSFLTFGELQSTGSVQVVQWTDGAPAWEVYSKMVHGPSTICSKNKSPICSCLTGFVPQSRDKWSKGNWTGGCVRRTELLCQQKGNISSHGVGLQDGFLKFSGLKLPDLAAIFRLDSASECERLCLNNCSCTAYAYVARIRCMVCSGDLLDMQDYSYSGEDLFLRLAYLEFFLGKRSNFVGNIHHTEVRMEALDSSSAESQRSLYQKFSSI